MKPLRLDCLSIVEPILVHPYVMQLLLESRTLLIVVYVCQIMNMHFSEQKDMEQLRSETWRAMEDALQQGLVRSIGVSNFSIEHLEALKKTAKRWPPGCKVTAFRCQVARRRTV